MAWYKAFMKKVLAHLQEKNADRVEGFKAGAK